MTEVFRHHVVIIFCKAAIVSGIVPFSQGVCIKLFLGTIFIYQVLDAVCTACLVVKYWYVDLLQLIE